MTSDSHLFKTREELENDGWTLRANVFEKDNARCLPLYEAKMTQSWDHRAADVVVSTSALQRQAQPRALSRIDHADPFRYAVPLYWVSEEECRAAMIKDWVRGWLLGFTNVTSPTNESTFLPTLIPFSGVGHSMSLIFPLGALESVCVLLSNLSSFAFDWVVRQKIGGVNLSFFIAKQLPVLSPETASSNESWLIDSSLVSWIRPRVLELAYTAWDLQGFARDCGYDGPPFEWDDERRFLIRCELDAAFFHLYSIERDDVQYIMETFPIVKRKDEQKYGTYRTKDTILEIYDEMAESIRTGTPYQTRLDPPPADPRVAHTARDRTGGLSE